MRYVPITVMPVKRADEIEIVRKNLKLKLKLQTHRCEWCDFIKEVKNERKRKLVHPRDRLALYKSTPSATKTKAIQENDIRIQEYVCDESDKNMD